MAPSVVELGCLVLLAMFLCHNYLSPLPSMIISNSILIIYYFTTSRRISYWKRNGVPGPSFLPFCGDFGEYIRALGKSKQNIQRQWMKKYGKLYGYYAGDIPILVVADRKLAHTVLKSFRRKDMTFVPSAADKTDYSRLQSMFMVEEEWNIFTKFTYNWLNTNSIKQMLGTIISFANKNIEVLDRWCEIEPVRVERALYDSLLDLICKLFSSKSFADLEIKADNLNVHNRSTDKDSIVLMKTHFPTLAAIAEGNGWLPRTQPPLEDAMQNFCRNVMDVFLIPATEMTDEVKESYLGSMAIKCQDAKLRNQKAPSEVELASQFLTFENTRNGMICLTALLFELCKNREMQNICRKECQIMFSSFQPSGWEELREKVPYLVASIYEAARLHPLTVTMERVCDRDDFELDGTPIPRGTMISVLVAEIMISEENFPNPSKFQPRRFIDTTLDQQKKNGYLAFGYGPRRCGGENFIMTILTVAAAHLLAAYEFSLANPDEQLLCDSVENSAYIVGNPSFRLKKIGRV